MSTAALLGIVMVIIAAAIEALSNVIQHKATNSVDKDGKSEASAVLRTLKKPLFLLGFLLMVIGYAFHVVSLGLGELAVIQVIFVTQFGVRSPVRQARVKDRDFAARLARSSDRYARDCGLCVCRTTGRRCH